MKIKGKKIKLGWQLMAIYQWEMLMNKPFELRTMFDYDVYLYSLVITNNDIDLTFEEFSHWLEQNADARDEFKKFIAHNDEYAEQFAPDIDDDNGEKKE